MPDKPAELQANFPTRQLLSWFRRSRRNLPWRLAPMPYSVWVAEVMLQQTVVGAVIDHYKGWMQRFPDVETLARASEEEVTRRWEGLGYYSRARNLHKAAKQVVAEYGGKIPGDYLQLRELPGVGDYTASAILSIAFNQRYPVLDANVRRVMQRMLLLREWDRGAEEKTRAFLARAMSRSKPSDFNEALMELGQTICRRSRAECARCPIADRCRSRIEGVQEDIPAKTRRSVEKLNTTVIIGFRQDKVLLTRRSGQLFRGLWLFPGLPSADVPEGSLSQPLVRLIERTHHYTRFANRLYPIVVRSGYRRFLQPDEAEMGKWVPISELERYPMPSVYRRIAAEFREWYDNQASNTISVANS